MRYIKKILFCSLIIILLLAGCTDITILNDALQEATPQETDESATTVPIEVRMRGIWLVGGSSGTNLISSIDLYDPVTDTWYPEITDLPTPRVHAGITLADGRIYVIGGIDITGEPTSKTEVFDILNHAWESGVSFPIAAQGLKAVTIGDKVYTIGGSIANNAQGAFSKIFKLNNVSGTWLPLYDIYGRNTYFRTDGAATELDGILFFSGGRTDAGTDQTGHYGHYVADYLGYFNATTISARFAHAAASFSSSMYKYIFYTGGTTIAGIAQPSISAALNTFYFYTPLLFTQSMTLGNSMNSARAYHGSIVWRTNVYVFGGMNSGTVNASYEYLTGINTTNIAGLNWHLGSTDMPMLRYGFEAVSADNFNL